MTMPNPTPDQIAGALEEMAIERPFCAWIGGTCDGAHACCDGTEDDDDYGDDWGDEDLPAPPEKQP